MNAISYVRISTIDQSQNSIPGQIERIERYCKKNNLSISRTFVENGQSAFNFNRKEWKELEAYLKENKSIKYLVIDTIDRFSRASLVDALQKMDEIQKRVNVKILTVSDPVNLDTEDFGVELRRIIELMFSNYELKKIRKRTSQGMQTAMKSGRWVNKAPYGYLNKRDQHGKPILEIDEEKAYVIRMIYRLYLSGMELEEIRKHSVAIGMKLKGNSTIRRVLSNPLYAGLIYVDKKTIPAIHPPIVSENDYWMAQAKLSRKRTTQRKENVFLVGILKCHCGKLFTTDKSKGKTGKEYRYYVCPKHRKAYSVDKLHDQFYKILQLLSLPEQSIIKIEAGLKNILNKKISNRTADLMKINLAIRKTKDKIDSVQEKYLTQPDISETIYKRIISDLRADESRLMIQRTQLDSNTSFDTIKEILPKLSVFHELFKDWPLYRKQEFINLVFDRELRYCDGVYRTRKVHLLFAHNLLELKEKKLLIIEQPNEITGETPESSPYGSVIETIEDLIRLIA